MFTAFVSAIKYILVRIPLHSSAVMVLNKTSLETYVSHGKDFTALTASLCESVILQNWPKKTYLSDLLKIRPSQQSCKKSQLLSRTSVSFYADM